MCPSPGLVCSFSTTGDNGGCVVRSSVCPLRLRPLRKDCPLRLWLQDIGTSCGFDRSSQGSSRRRFAEEARGLSRNARLRFRWPRSRGLQRRGPCPIHGQPGDTQPTFSAHLGRNIFQCFHVDCQAQGNVLDLWAAIHHLPLYEAALNLAETFRIPRNREEEPVQGTC
jgi:CHC2 zinc finger